MLINSFSFILLAFTTIATAKTCTNHGAERCASSNGSDATYYRCELGNEVEYQCPGEDKCYGNGLSGIMCIEKPLLSKRQTVSKSDFQGYEGIMNTFIRGVNGDANSMKTWITQSRTAMFTDKNAIPRMSNAMVNGVTINKSTISGNLASAPSSVSSTQGKAKAIDGAKKFSNSISQNQADFAYLLTDVAVSSAKDPNSRMGTARMIGTTLRTSVGDTYLNKNNVATTQASIEYLSSVLKVYYPTTLGKVFTRGLAPKNLATSLAHISAGNVNVTDVLYQSMLKGFRGREKYLAGFAAGSTRATQEMMKHANPSIVGTIHNRYSSPTTNLNLANSFLGAAKFFTTKRNAYAGQIDTAFRTFRDTTDACADFDICDDSVAGDQDSFSTLLTMILALVGTTMVTPATGCCYGNGGGANIFARSLVV